MDIKTLIGWYLAKPWARMVVIEADSTFRGEIVEFPGCVVSGKTPEEAQSLLEDAAVKWLAKAIVEGRTVPTPFKLAANGD